MSQYSTLQFDLIKEAISDYCAFSLGKQIILDSDVSFVRLKVERDLKRCREMIDLVIRYGSLPLGGLTDITDALTSAQKEITLSSQDLYRVANHAYVCDNISSYLRKSDIETEEIRDLVSSLEYSIALSKEIQRCINDAGEVNDNASPLLKSLRKDLKNCENELIKEASSFIRHNPSKVSDDIITTRSDRYVVLVKTSEKNTVGGFVHGESNSGQTTYLEPQSLLLLNNRRSTILSNIEDEIYRILSDLSMQVKKVADRYLSNMFTLSLLDSLNAKAMWAKENEAVCLEIGDRLMLKQARHPLIERKKVVANTYRLMDGKRMLLISGPNTGGKTVSLKIIGLFACLTLAGFPVTCLEGSIPMFDNIFVDIGDEQSISDDLSTFSAHIKKISYICENATSDSLVLLDEPGDGTDPKEGECLAIAILDYLREKNCYTFVTTHFTKLKTYGNKYDSILCASVEFDSEKLIPTYRFIEGVTGQSNALEIARRIGLDDTIIERASELKVSGRTKEESLIESLEASLASARLKEDRLNEERKEMQAQKEQLEHQIDIYTRQKEKLLKQAEKEADEYLNGQISKADSLIKKMLNTDQVHEVIQIKHELEEIENGREEETADENHEFITGDYVSIRNSNQRGTIEKIDRKKAVVNVNGLKITAKLTDLVYAGIKPAEVIKDKTYYSVSKPSQLSFELNLIGKHVDEALIELDSYLDQAILMKAPFVRIIHGYGSGALRKAIWDHLKNNRFIDSMRYGNENEGSSGATVITFKKKQ